MQTQTEEKGQLEACSFLLITHISTAVATSFCKVVLEVLFLVSVDHMLCTSMIPVGSVWIGQLTQTTMQSSQTFLSSHFQAILSVVGCA